MAFNPTANVTTALPKLPGFNFPELHERSSFNKSHTLIYCGAMATFVPLDSSGVRPEKAIITLQDIKAAHPEWTSTADKVLRFYAYFVEKVSEASWVRPVTLMYFLEDGQTLIMEPNSVNQRFLKKQVIPEVTPVTLKVGASLVIKSRKFTLIDCDDFTRSIYERLGHPQPEAKPLPKDDQPVKQTPSPLRATVGPPKKLISAINRSILENDKKVLRFPCYWCENRAEPRLFDFLYFIADGTVSIQERIHANSGRDPAANFYKRSRLPKGCDKSALTKALDTIAPTTVPEYYTLYDLDVGITVRVYGRAFVLYDADAYTRTFFSEELGRELGQAVALPEGAYATGSGLASTTLNKFTGTLEVTLPPYTGIGSDEDSMGSLRYLVLKPPKKDLKKMLKHGKDILRFRASLYNARPEDIERRFVICYYVGDDSVSVYEQVNGQNTGFSAGRFLVRQRVRVSKPTEPAKYLTAEDFQVGSTITINHHVFFLDEMDERTESFLEGSKVQSIIPDSVTTLVSKLRTIITMKYSRYTDAFRAYNISKGRGLSVEEIARMFDDASVNVDEDQVMNVMHYLDTDGDGFVGFSEFVQYMAASDDGGHKTLETTKGTTASYRNAVHNVKEKQFSNQVFKMFRDNLSNRRLVLVDSFRMISDRSPDSLVGWKEFRQVVNDYLQMNFTEEQLDALCKKFFVSAVDSSVVDQKRRLNLREFQRLLEQDTYAL